jgi:hypothetical protein
MIITSIDTLTSMLGAFTIFCILGNVMEGIGAEEINDFLKKGPALGFVSYAHAFANFDVVPQVSDMLCIRVR